MATVLRRLEATLLKGEAKWEASSQTATRKFYLVLDEPPADVDEVVQLFWNDGGTVPGEPYRDGDVRLCKSVKVTSLGTLTDYVIDVDFEKPANETSQNNPNPLMRPDEISVSGSSNTRPFFKDYTSPTPEKATTTAGEPFQTLPENFVGSFELTIRGNRSTFDASTWPSYLRPACAINTSSVTIRGITFAAGTLLMKNMRMTGKFENDVSFFEFEWTLAVADTWDQVIENRGFSSLEGGKLTPIMQKGDPKTPVSAPYPLNTDGSKMTNPTDTPSTKTFKPQPKKNFSIFAWTSAA